MTRYNGGTKVDGGYYLNLKGWGFEAISGDAGMLPNDGEYVRVPGIAVIPALLVLSFVFVVFMPTIGLAMAAWALMKKVGSLVGMGTKAVAETVAPAYQPGLAMFATKTDEEKKSAPPATEALSELEREIAEKRSEEEKK
jgi:hypothetical protein